MVRFADHFAGIGKMVVTFTHHHASITVTTATITTAAKRIAINNPLSLRGLNLSQ